MRSLALGVLLWGAAALGQDAVPKPKVLYVAEQQTVAAGKRAVVELRFQVRDGFHVNSHTPKSELLLPTVLEVKPVAGVALSAAVYPAGQSYGFAFDPTEKLDVYTGEFLVKLPVVAERGEHAAEGMLRYQACDAAACYPPKVLAVKVLFTAR